MIFSSDKNYFLVRLPISSLEDIEHFVDIQNAIKLTLKNEPPNDITKLHDKLHSVSYSIADAVIRNLNNH